MEKPMRERAHLQVCISWRSYREARSELLPSFQNRITKKGTDWNPDQTAVWSIAFCLDDDGAVLHLSLFQST